MSAHVHAAPVGGRMMTPSARALFALFGVAMVLVAWRLIAGLGATTAMNDGYPFGLWIAFDVVTGTALACGGYAVAILVYILNRGQYSPLVRPALLTSALGYSLAGIGVALDVGRWWDLWRVPVYFWRWNLNSALLEIAVETRGNQLRLAPLDDTGTLIRKHFLQLEGLGVRDLHFSGDDLYILAGPTMVLNGDIRVFKWPAARPVLAANRDPVRFESALTKSVSLPHGHGINRAEAMCDLPLALSGGKASWLVLYDAPGADRKEGEHTVFGDLLRHG